MAFTASFDLFEEADVLVDDEFEAPVVLFLPNALLTNIGVSYFTSEKVF